MLVGLAQERLDQGGGVADIPKPLLEMPDLGSLCWLYTAFLDLSSCRSMGVAIGPIPWTAIQAYANEWDLVEYPRALLFSAIRCADDMVVSYYANKSKEAGNQSS